MTTPVSPKHDHKQSDHQPTKQHGQARAASAQTGQQKKRLLLAINNPAFFLSHRLEIGRAALAQGYEVHVATMDGPSVPEVVSYGFHHHVLPLSRSGKNPVRELYSIFVLWRLMRRLRPDVVHTVTIKPVLYGGIAARLAGRRVGGFIAAISGLGYIFTSSTGWLRRVVLQLYRLALGHKDSRVIVQNPADQALLVQSNVVEDAQCVLIPGSGVDCEQFRFMPEPDVQAGQPLRILMVARLLKDKGVREYVAAAKQAQEQGFDWQWCIAGSTDSGNPASLSDEQMQQWHEQGIINWLGEREDIAALYEQAHIAVLPSYREGLPKSLLEAAAAGRPVVTTDVPGCRDAIIVEQTGLLVPVQDSAALLKAVHRLATDKALREKMGQAARQLACERFELGAIVAQHLQLYEQMQSMHAPKTQQAPKQ